MVTNVIYHTSELDGFDLIKNEDKSLLKQTIEIENATRKLPPLKTNSEKNRVETPTLLRKSQLKPINVPAINVMFTNSDQLTAAKMFELKNRIIQEKTLIIAVCEVKPKNGNERTLKDYKIPGFSIHPVNLDSTTGRGIAVYTHNSFDKSTIQIKPELRFDEVCLLEIRLCGVDFVTIRVLLCRIVCLIRTMTG